MSTFDPSRTPYLHWRCRTLPCTCHRVHVPLLVRKIPCWEPTCPETFRVMTELSEHHLKCHEVPYDEA